MARRSKLTRRLFWLAICVFGAVLSVFSIANHASVTIDLWPLPMGVDLPVFALVLGMLGFGMVAGGLLFWVQMLSWRVRARRLERRVAEVEATSQAAAKEAAVFQPVGVTPETTAGTRGLPVH